MDGSFVPLILAALIAGIVGTWMELRASLEPATCPECRHCSERAELRRLEQLAEQQRQADLQSAYARRMGLHRTDEGGLDEDRQRRD
jgi:hypothetical protein